MKFVLASNNQGKLKEFKEIFSKHSVEVVAQSEFDVDEVDETGLTFIENAILKARYASKISGLPALGDDSGLVVDALNGAPGIYSARYAGEHGNTAANIERLLHEMKDVPDEQRQAFFICVLVYVKHSEDPTPIVCQGLWHGVVTREVVGENGFGYDPVFFVPDQQCTAAQLTKEIKNMLSHRAKAITKLIGELCTHSK